MAANPCQQSYNSDEVSRRTNIKNNLWQKTHCVSKYISDDNHPLHLLIKNSILKMYLLLSSV